MSHQSHDKNAPSTSSGTTSKSLDPTEEHFDPLQALYAKELKSENKTYKTYDNLAMFESALQKLGVAQVGFKMVAEKNKTALSKTQLSGKTKCDDTSGTSFSERRFLPHQMPIQSKGAMKARHTRNLYKKMEESTGPISWLYKMFTEKRKIKIYTRKEHGVRGFLTGTLIAFDKHWNLLLVGACETFKRRKFNFSKNEANLGQPRRCDDRLRRLGIRLPETEVKSLNRKYVEITRKCNQLMIRGEQIVLVTEYVEENIEKKNE